MAEGRVLYSGWYLPDGEETIYYAPDLDLFIGEGGWDVLPEVEVPYTMELGGPNGRTGIVLDVPGVFGETVVQFQQVNVGNFRAVINNWLEIHEHHWNVLRRGYWLQVRGIWEQGHLILVLYQPSVYVDVGLNEPWQFQVPELRRLGYTTIVEDGLVTWWCEVPVASMAAGLNLRAGYHINNLNLGAPLPARIRMSSERISFIADVIAVARRLEFRNLTEEIFLELELSVESIMMQMVQANIQDTNLITELGNEVSIYYGSQNGVLDLTFRPYV